MFCRERRLREATSAEKLNEITLLFPHRVFTVSPHLHTLLNIRCKHCAPFYMRSVKWNTHPSLVFLSLLQRSNPHIWLTAISLISPSLVLFDIRRVGHAAYCIIHCIIHSMHKHLGKFHFSKNPIPWEVILAKCISKHFHLSIYYIFNIYLLPKWWETRARMTLSKDIWISKQIL